FLKPSSIFVVPGSRKGLSELIDEEHNLREIISYTRLPVKRRCTQTQLEDYPDSDLFAMVKPHHYRNPWRLLAIINCKADFRSRCAGLGLPCEDLFEDLKRWKSGIPTPE